MSNGTNIDFEFMPFNPDVREAVKAHLLGDSVSPDTFSKLYKAIHSNDFLPQYVDFISVRIHTRVMLAS